MAWIGDERLREMGFAQVGAGALISDKASFHNCAKIRIGARTRIDDFVVVSAGEGGIELGSNVHVAVFCSLIGKASIRLGDYANLSSRVAVYSSSDDFSGASMTNPTVSEHYTDVLHAPVAIGAHVIVGSGSVVLPGVTLETGVAIGALSLVRHSCEAFTAHAGNPLRRLGERRRDLLELQQRFEASLRRDGGSADSR